MEKICISYSPVGFALKLSKALRDELKKKEGINNLQHFPDAPIKKDYIVLSEGLLKDRERLCFWVDKSIEYVLNHSRDNKTGRGQK